MKKLILFLLLIPALVNAQVTPGDRIIDFARLQIGDGSRHFPSMKGSQVVGKIAEEWWEPSFIASVEKITIGNIPAALYKPSDFDPTKKYPVWIFFHGLGEMAKQASEIDRLIANGNHSGLLSAAEKYKFIVVAPQLVQAYNNWTPGWTKGYVNPILSWVVKNAFTDISHIVATGLSLGGGGAWVAATSDYAQYISAVIPICATPQYDQDFSLIAQNNTPVWAFVAKDDLSYYTAQVNMIASVNKYSPTPEPKSTVYNSGGHSVWGTVYNTTELYTWAMSQNNVPGTIPTPAPVDEILSSYRITVYKSGKIEIIKQ
jgi:predicted peptidase